MIIIYPEASPSNNILLNMHYRDKTREHKRVTALMFYAIKQSLPGRALKKKMRCHAIVTRCGERALDWDNYGGGLKFIFDALIKCGVIDDDNPKVVLSLKLKQRRCKKNEECTIIELIPEYDVKRNV
jgi:hypothetical protein